MEFYGKGRKKGRKKIKARMMGIEKGRGGKRKKKKKV